MPTELLPLAAAAGIALSGGGSGYLSVPNADTLAVDSFVYQHDTGLIAVNDPRTLSLKRSLNDHVQFGVASFLEFGARLTTWYDEASGRRTYNDLSGHFKLKLLETDSLRLAVGARDFAGEATSLDPAYFVVGDWKFNKLDITLGYGASDEDEAALGGAFGGLRYTPWPWLSLMADHDSQEWQAGAQVQNKLGPVALFAKAYYSSNEEKEFAYALGIQVPLRQQPANQLVAADFPKLATPVEQAPQRRWSDAVLFPWAADNFADVVGQQQQIAATDGQCGPDLDYQAQQLSILAVRCHDSQYTVSWDNSFASSLKPRWGLFHLQARVEPAMRYSIGTEVGRFDYSLALRSSLQLLLPLGLSGYSVWDVPVDDTEAYDDGGAFSGGRYTDGVFEQAVALTLHPLPGLFVQGQLGRTQVAGDMYDYSRLEAVWQLWDGRFALSGSATSFEQGRNNSLAERQVLGRGFFWVKPGRYALQLTGGDFQFGDEAVRLDMFRYIGRIRLALYGKANDSFKTVGFAVSMPLTGRAAWQSKHFSVAGTPHFQPSLETEVDADDGVNTLRPNFAREFVPQRDLLNDVLDQMRASPSYINHR